MLHTAIAYHIIRIIVIDERSFIAESLKMRLNTHPSLAVQNISSSTEDLVASIHNSNCDVLLISDQPQEHHSLIQLVRSQFQGLKILVTAFSFVREAVELAFFEANGIVLKDYSVEQLTTAIHQVNETGEFYPPEAETVLREIAKQERTVEHFQFNLTQREKETLQCIADDMKTDEIARTLKLAVNTIDAYRKNILSKLGVHTMPGAVKKALVFGLIK